MKGNTMTAETKSSAGNNILWAAVGALGVAVIALGALLYTRSQPSAPQPALAPAAAPAASAPVAATPPQAPKAATPAPARTATKASPAEKTPSTTATAPAPARETCANCGTVMAVTPVEREGEPSGAGAVAGGVLGALVGQQFGQGGGKTATTVLGAVGGGVAGHEVEKRMKKVTVYQVQLRMDDGGTRTLEQASPPSVGARVRVDGNSLQPMPGN
jgi:outer membrane lipoprotein SlyB